MCWRGYRRAACIVLVISPAHLLNYFAVIVILWLWRRLALLFPVLTGVILPHGTSIRQDFREFLPSLNRVSDPFSTNDSTKHKLLPRWAFQIMLLKAQNPFQFQSIPLYVLISSSSKNHNQAFYSQRWTRFLLFQPYHTKQRPGFRDFCRISLRVQSPTK